MIDLADLLCGPGRMRRVGERWIARCPLPDHEDRTPSFTVYPTNNSWYCFGCLRGGDVVDLAAAAWNYGDGEAAMAAANVLHEFGHEIPPRPDGWYGKQRRQQPVRDMIDREKIEHIRLLIFRLIWAPHLRRLPEWVREDAAKEAWQASRSIALKIYEGRRAA